MASSTTAPRWRRSLTGRGGGHRIPRFWSRRSPDPGAVASYLRYLCVPAPRTIFREVEKLAPGHRLEVNAANVAVRCYWDVADVARRGQQACDRRAEPDIVEELHALLADAVKRQMVSDVPVGAFLSGGIDSSAVVALMQRAA